MLNVLLNVRKNADCFNQNAQTIRDFYYYSQEVHHAGDMEQYNYELNFFAESRIELVNNLSAKERTKLLVPYEGNLMGYITAEAKKKDLMKTVLDSRNASRLFATQRNFNV